MPKRISGHVKSGCLVVLFLLLTGFVFAQNPVTGKVTNKTDNTPVPGASIQIKGTKVLVQTGADGAFTIHLPKSDGTLIISAVGFTTLEVPVTAGANVGDIALTTSSTTLSSLRATLPSAKETSPVLFRL